MSIRQSYFVSFFALLVVAALLPLEVQAWWVEILEPDENDVHLKGDEINWQAKFYPTDTHPEDISWNFFYTQGSGTPSSGSGTQVADTREFHSTVTSEGTVKLKVQATVSATTYEDERTIKAVVPYVVKVGFAGTGEHTIKDGGGTISDPIWDTTLAGSYKTLDGGDKDKPVAYTKESSPTLNAKVWVEYDLTTAASIHLDAVGPDSMDFNADGGSIQSGISAYFTLPSSGGGNDKFKNYVYKYGPTVGYGTPNNAKYQLQWKYRIDGDATWMDINTSSHVIYLTSGTPQLPESTPSVTVLNFACGWAQGKTTPASICTDILSNGFSSHYTWDMNCHRLSSDFVRMVSSLGVSASQHKWASKGDKNLQIGDVGDMCYQKTNTIDPVGPTWGSQQIEWSWHQWAEAASYQRDPSTAASRSGNWGSYEDYLFYQYNECTQTSPTWQSVWVSNQSGQSSGCEVYPTHCIYDSSPTLYSWRGPTR